MDGGDGGSNYGYNFGIGGNGGAATLLAPGAVSIDSTGEAYVQGGDGGDGYGTAGVTEGSGGNAFAALGSLTLTSTNYYIGNLSGEYGYLEVGGGDGGWDYTEGAGGNGGNGGNGVLLVTAGVSIDSAGLDVYGGEGGGSYGGNAGNGGNALLSVGTNLTVTSTYDYSGLNVKGGAGSYNDDYGPGVGGSGGNGALMTSGGVSVDSGYVSVGGGNGGYTYGGNGGNGGNAELSVGTNLTVTSSYDTGELYIEAGNGGVNYEDYNYGTAGNGGAATLLVAGAVSMDSAYAYISGGNAGSYGYGDGVTEGSGGSAYASMNSLTLTSDNYLVNEVGQNTSFTLQGGTGAIDYYDGNQGDGGNGGHRSSVDQFHFDEF